MNIGPFEIEVKVYLPSKEISEGILTYSSSGPKVSLRDGREYNANLSSNHITFSILEENSQLPISVEEKVALNAVHTKRMYEDNLIKPIEMYPKSTEGWISCLSESGIEAQYIAHNIVGSNKKLLVIIDLAKDVLLSAYRVNSFEIAILFMNRDWDIYKKLFAEPNFANRESLIWNLLDRAPPKWSELSVLVEGVNVPNLNIGRNMRNTMEQLVPNSFPADVREELMAFLSLVMNLEIPSDDPLNIAMKYRSTPLLHSLIFHHINCHIEGDDPPQYVRILNMADRGLIPIGMQPTVEGFERNPWDIAWFRLTSMFPDRRGEILQMLSEMNLKDEIKTVLPISMKEAESSRIKWMNRYALILYSSSIRGHVQNQKIGLRTLIYIGGAHRWPHQHLAWTARLGNPNEKPPYIQVMLMPQSAAERVLRVRQNISEVFWSTMNVNFGLYNNKTKKWKANTARILQSIGRKRTLKQLEREFSIKTNGNIRIPSLEEAKLLGFITSGMNLSSLEEGIYEKYLGLNQERLNDLITKLKNLDIVHPRYFIHMLGLASMCIVAKGPALNIQSLSRAFLKHTPSTTARLTNGGNESIIISRMSEESAYEISSKLPSIAQDELEVKVMRINAYAAYTHNLYERLLLPDGTWDDDISGFLSQIRS
ncbi:MAG: hypothetical protein ACTSWA_11505 [Candidatus Thorarchaeota archaeon]